MTEAALLTTDQGHRWREDATKEMAISEIIEFLFAEAAACEKQDEWECAYGIYRELLWRSPRNVQAWRAFSNVASKLGYQEEATVAQMHVDSLPSGE